MHRLAILECQVSSYPMLVVMQEGAQEAQTQNVIDRLVSMGFIVHRSSGMMHTVLGGVGPVGDVDPIEFEVMPGVKECHRIVSPYKLASRHFKPGGTKIRIGDVEIGGEQVVVMAGPCSVESRDQISQVAEAVAKSGARVLRGGAFKPRTSPYSFQGMGEDGLKLLREAADRTQLLLVSEVMDQTQIPLIAKYVDILQVGARNMQNYNLLRELGTLRKPVLLKRGISATVEELLLSAEYILSGGNYDVILCERGIRTFENSTRNTMDISAIPVVKSLSHLPIVADPSHGTGRRDKVLPMARAAVAAGADGLLVEVHHDPDHALSDGAQSLFPQQFAELMDQLRIIAQAVGRSI
jgi:3-deoxy-7-phosphoheptulonate synthase